MPRSATPPNWPKLLKSLDDAAWDGEPDRWLDCIFDAAKAAGATAVAERMGIDRTQLYAALSHRKANTHRNPEFAFLWSLSRALGLHFTATRDLPDSPVTVAETRQRTKKKRRK